MLQPERLRELEEFIEEIQAEHSIPGLSVALAKDGNILFAKGFGWANREEGVTADPDTIYGVASVTKSFTAAAILLLEQDGLLSTGDPVTSYLPEYQLGTHTVTKTATIHHFLNHSAGLPPTSALRYAMVRSIQDDPSAKLLQSQGKWDEWIDHEPIDTYEELLGFLRNCPTPPLGPLGAQFSYSNDAYALLCAIVERVSGMPLADFVNERILQPLGMERSFFDRNDVNSFHNVTQLYLKDEEDTILPAPFWNDAPSMVGAGFLKSTVLDLIRYGELYHGKRQDILRTNSVSEMMTPYLPCGRGNYYGYGLMVHPNYHGMKVIEHGGSLKGIASNFGIIPEKDLTAAVVANIVDVPAHRIWLAAINAALDLPLDEPLSREPAYEKNLEEIKRWVGTYTSGEGAEIAITLEGDVPYLEAKGSKQSIRQSGPASAAITYRGAEMGISFVNGADGSVSAIEYGYRIVPRQI